MFAAATIRGWCGHTWVTPRVTRSVGLEAVCVDTRTGLPSFGTVKAGTPARHRLVLVPVDRAAVGLGYLKVCYGRKQVKDAPPGGTDGELPAAGEEAIFKALRPDI